MPQALIEPSVAATRPLYRTLARGRRKADGLSSDQVAAHQRSRLYGAMIELATTRGYAATTTRALAAAAAMSKQDMYKLFPSKEAYFLATYDFIVRRGIRRIGVAYACEGDWRERLRGAFLEYAALVVEEPKAAGLVLVEVLGAGPAGVGRLEHTRAGFEQMISASFRQAPDGVSLPPLVVKGIVCGLERVTRQRLLMGGIEELPALAEELLEWVLSYRSPAGSALPAVAPAPHAARRARPREGDRVRMLHVAAKIAARDGYANLGELRIAHEAGVTLDTFDALFEGGVEQCFLDALNRLGLEALVYAAKRSRSTDDRLAGVHRGILALMEHLARDPVLIQIAFVEVFAVGPAGIARREWLLRQFRDLLVSSLPASERPSDLIAEAIVGAIWGLIHHQVVTRGSHRLLPGLTNYASYLALAPAIGAQAALETILGAACQD